MTMRAVRWAVVAGGLVLGVVIAPIRAQQAAGDRKEEVRRIVAVVQRSAEDHDLRRRKAQLELEVLMAQVEAKKAEIALAEAEFRVAKNAPDFAILSALNRPMPMHFREAPLDEVIQAIRRETTDANAGLPDGVPLYIDPQGLIEADKTLASPVSLELEGIPLRTTFRILLRQLGLTYVVKDGVLTITSPESLDEPIAEMPGR